MRLALIFRTGCVTVLLGAGICSLAQTKPRPDARRQAALQFEQQGKLDEAKAAWTALSKTNPRNPEPYAHLGLIASHQERYSDAVPNYRKALAITPNVQSVRLDLALALFKSGQTKEAIPEFEKLLKAAPKDSDQEQRFTILLGMAHYAIADYANAVPYLKAATERDKTNRPLLLALAHSYLWSRQFQYVLDIYHQILVLDPGSAEASMLAGEALDEMKDNAGATEMFRAAVKADPKMPNVHFGLGYLLWTQKQYPEAARELQAELDNDPGHVQSLVYLADANIQLNKMDVARPLLEQAIKLDPSQSLAHLDLGIVYSELGQNEEALRELLIAEKMVPDDVNVHWRLGRLYRSMGRKEEARLEFDQASKLNKKADEDLYKKIADGAKKQAPAESSNPPTQ
jgi:tetratricopeptide (TPR) repeat protein